MEQNQVTVKSPLGRRSGEFRENMSKIAAEVHYKTSSWGEQVLRTEKLPNFGKTGDSTPFDKDVTLELDKSKASTLITNRETGRSTKRQPKYQNHDPNFLATLQNARNHLKIYKPIPNGESHPPSNSRDECIEDQRSGIVLLLKSTRREAGPSERG